MLYRGGGFISETKPRDRHEDRMFLACDTRSGALAISQRLFETVCMVREISTVIKGVRRRAMTAAEIPDWCAARTHHPISLPGISEARGNQYFLNAQTRQ